jgi:disulfide bond formation protein DsbB
VVRFLALLSLSSITAVVGILLASIARPSRTALVSWLGPLANIGATIVAGTSTIGSLYFSEGAHFTPCRLCWYQRIAMYPLVVILVVALVAKDRHVHRYVLPLGSIGALVSMYHIAIERFPQLESSTSCDPNNPCSLKWVEEFGFVTIPTMALTAFLLIITLCIVGRVFHCVTRRETPMSPFVEN